MASDPAKPNKDPIDPQPIDLDADAPNYDINDMDDFDKLFNEEPNPVCLHENIVFRPFTTFEFWQCQDCGQEVPKPSKPVGFDFDTF